MDRGLMLKGVSFGYTEAEVLKDLSLTFKDSGIVSIIGPNGSGKSTILRLIARLLRPEKGYVLLDGKNILSLPTKAVAKRLAILTQNLKCPEDIRVKDLVSYGRTPYSSIFGSSAEEDRRVINWAIEVCGLKDLSERPVVSLSGGERQRAWIAMVLAQRTDLLLLDEPITYLDIHHQIEMMELVRRLNVDYGVRILMVLHDINLAIRFSQRLIAVKDGQIVGQDCPKTLITEDFLLKVFNIKAEIMTKAGLPYIIPWGIVT